MELRQYWNVIWRRRWLVLAIVLLSALVSVVLYVRTQPTYEAQIRFITRQAPDAPGVETGLFLNQPNGYWIGSEFLVDDYTEIVKSDSFAKAVNDAIGGGMNVPLIKAYIDADRKNRELRLIITGRTRDEAQLLAEASAKVLTELRLKPVSGTMADDKAVFTQIDAASPETIKSSTSKDLINALIRFLIGLALALALAFVLEYLDNSVRDERDARNVLDLPVLGTIPRA
jgi:capsular polysaccharide biosynthesis protein